MFVWKEHLNSTGEAKVKILSQSSNTHIAISLNQTGIQGDVFQIGVLIWKSCASVDKVLERSHLQDSSTIILGRVTDTSSVPCFVVLNRGKQTQTIIGPNRIYYDSLNGDEFKVLLPQGFCGQQFSALLNEAQPTIEVYSTSLKNSNIKLAT